MSENDFGLPPDILAGLIPPDAPASGHTALNRHEAPQCQAPCCNQVPYVPWFEPGPPGDWVERRVAEARREIDRQCDAGEITPEEAGRQQWRYLP